MKLMIVEDDPLTRRGIRSKVSAANSELQHVIEAKDGLEGLELFKVGKPDICLVDVIMPRMNGLEFIRQAKSIKPDAAFVILTCTHDFNVAKEAIALGVSSLLNKSDLDGTVFTDTVRQLTSKVMESLRNDRLEADARRMSFFRELLNGRCTSEEKIKTQLSGLGLPAQGPYSGWVIAFVDSMRCGVPLNASDIEKIAYGTVNIAQELYGGAVLGHVVDAEDKRLYLCLGPGAGPSPRLIRAVRSYLTYDVAVAESAAFASLLQWSVKVKESEDLLQHRWFEREETAWCEERDSFIRFLPEPVVHWERRIKQRISELKLDEALGDLEEGGDMIRAQRPRPHPGIVCRMFEAILFHLYEMCESAYHHPALHQAQQTALEKLNQADSLQEALEILKGETASLKELVFLHQQARNRKQLIADVRSYIENRPLEMISLYFIAECFHVNPSYLSRIFKEEAGQSFSDYVLDRKLTRAEHMIRNGKRLTEVANMLGYMNASSFTRMYKKIKGVPPSSFLRG